MLDNRRLGIGRIVTIFTIALIVYPFVHAEAISQAKPVTASYVIDFASYKGGSVDEWLKTRNYTFERDAKNRRLLGLSIADGVLTLEAKGRMSGFILNDSVNVEKGLTIRINWGVKNYPQNVSYQNKVNNEALMLYIFFGKEKISSGHVLIPNSPYFIGLFLCQDEQVNFPYKGRYFHTGGRFVCLGKPEPGRMIASEFDLDRNFKNYFGKNETPGITGIGFGVDTSKAGGGGAGAAFIRSIEFFEESTATRPGVH
jgi:hypothetical protein